MSVELKPEDREIKSLRFEPLKQTFKRGDGSGEGEGYLKCVFCTMGVIDKHGDRLLKGAFGEQKVMFSAYNHGSGSFGGQLPIGKGKVYEDGDKAIFEGNIFVEEFDNARDTYKVIKLAGNLQEYSFNLNNVSWTLKREDGRYIYEISKVVVGEVSPVLKGAGLNTRTVQIKTLDPSYTTHEDEETAPPEDPPNDPPDRDKDSEIEKTRAALKAFANEEARRILEPYAQEVS